MLKFEFDNTQYNSYLYEAEPFLTSLQKIGAFLALFKLGGLFEICHRRKHERRLTKRFLRKLDKQKEEERKLTTMPAASLTPTPGPDETPNHIQTMRVDESAKLLGDEGDLQLNQEMHAQLLIEEEGYFGRNTDVPKLESVNQDENHETSISSDTESTVSSEATLEEERQMKWWQRFFAFIKNEWGKFRVCCRRCCADNCANCCKKGKRKKKAVVLTEESLRSVRKLFSFETFFDMYQTYKRHEVLVT